MTSPDWCTPIYILSEGFLIIFFFLMIPGGAIDTIKSKHNFSEFRVVLPLYIFVFVFVYLPSLILLAIAYRYKRTALQKRAKFTGRALIMRITWQALGYPLLYLLTYATFDNGDDIRLLFFILLTILPVFVSLFATNALNEHYKKLGGAGLLNELFCKKVEEQPIPQYYYIVQSNQPLTMVPSQSPSVFAQNPPAPQVEGAGVAGV